jgi:hypothetical protein
MTIDWTNVIVAVIFGLPAIISAIAAVSIHRQIRTPSGENIGNVAEKTHDMSNANFALVKKINDNGHWDGEERRGTAASESA